MFLFGRAPAHGIKKRGRASPLALFARENMEAKKELKQWLNPSRVYGITRCKKMAMKMIDLIASS
jgi:hypothetical protein